VGAVSFENKDLNLLIALRALLEEANVTRAGARVDMGQSSMSTALSRLRTQFGDELLVRVGRDYELTPLAKLILPQLEAAIPLIENALMSHEAFNPATSNRKFKIMASDAAQLELKPRISKALAEAPGISIEYLPLPSQPTDSEREMLVNDFVVAVAGIGITGECRALYTDHYVLLVDANNDSLVDGELSWEAFKALPQAVVKLGQGHLLPADRKLGELGFRRVPAVKINSYMPLASVISGTQLVGIVPSRLAKTLCDGTGLIAVRAPFGDIELHQNLWWHQSHDNEAAHRWMREILTNPAS
jgi:DNA-binding transcriptional LysR family regulator